MKVLLDPAPDPAPDTSPVVRELHFPAGIVGFPEHRRGEVFHLPDQLPFQWLRLHGPDPLHFVVIDPSGVVADYAPELFDDDAHALRKGILALQLHAGKPMWVEFRDIKLRQFPAE